MSHDAKFDVIFLHSSLHLCFSILRIECRMTPTLKKRAKRRRPTEEGWNVCERDAVEHSGQDRLLEVMGICSPSGN